MANAKITKTASWRTRPLIPLLIIAAAVALPLGIFAYGKYSARQDRQKFEQARAAIDSVYADIVAQVGPPARHKSDQSCDYASSEFGKGPLGCSIYMAFAYAVKDASQATQLAKKVNSTAANRTDLFAISYSNTNQSLPFSPLKDAHDYQIVSNDYLGKKSRLDCYLISTYAHKDSLYLSITTKNSEENLSVLLGCKGPVKEEIYPVKNS